MEKPTESSFSKTSDKDFSDNSFLITSFLDPVFKFEFITHSNLNSNTQKELKTKILGLLIAELPVSGNTASNQSQSNSSHDDSNLNQTRTGNESPMKRRKFFSFIDKASSAPSPKQVCDATRLREEIRSYIELKYNEDEQGVEFWNINQNKYPLLYSMALKYLSIPATSAPVERLFSSSGYIMRPHRSKLIPEHLIEATLLRCNFNLIINYIP